MVAAASVPPNVDERSKVGENMTFGGTEAAATIVYLDKLFICCARY